VRDSDQAARITGDMVVDEVMRLYPATAEVFYRHKMHCAGCYISNFHNIATSAQEYDVELDDLLAELNARIGA
jgi:hybrid cluster-associated redox disulfide protein